MDHKLLITGGTGFVGKHLQEVLKDRGIEFYTFSKAQCDLTVKEQTETLFAAHSNVDVIIHLASYQAAGDFPAKHPGEQFYINNLIHINVLESWRKFLPDAKLIAIGSSCAYPSNAKSLTEDVFLDGDIHGSVYSYAFTKRLLYNGIKSYNDQYKLNGNYLIPATMYGEYDDFHVETAHVSGALIGKFVKAVRERAPEVEIWGDGTQIREFIYVNDFINILLSLIDLCNQDIINIGTGKGRSIKDLVTAIYQASGFQGKLTYNVNAYVGVKEKFMNTNKLEQKYGLSIKDDFSGIAKTVSWFAQNYDEYSNKRKFSKGI